jgi:hypothetical protein
MVDARTLKQLEDSLAAIDVKMSAEQVNRLERVSAVELGFPHDFLARPLTQAVIFRNMKIPNVIKALGLSCKTMIRSALRLWHRNSLRRVDYFYEAKVNHV